VVIVDVQQVDREGVVVADGAGRGPLGDRRARRGGDPQRESGVRPEDIIVQDFRFPSFPRQRESSKLLKRLDIRFRGYDEFTGLAKVLLS
jgi:hypothetical protein